MHVLALIFQISKWVFIMMNVVNKFFFFPEKKIKMNYQKVYMNHIHSSSLLCQLAQMWRSQLLCDALICTGNVVTKVRQTVKT